MSFNKLTVTIKIFFAITNLKKVKNAEYFIIFHTKVEQHQKMIWHFLLKQKHS